MNKCNLLFSYAIFQTNRTLSALVLPLAGVTRVLIDSGAFTNYAGDRKEIKGKKRSKPVVTLDAYTKACQTWHGEVWQYVQLDEIRNQEQTTRNLNVMLDAGLLPMPVIVENDWNWDRVAELMDITPYICIAGGVKTNDRFAHKRYQQAYKASGQRALIHALGYTRWPTTLQLPLKSCDSSTYSTGSQYGYVPAFFPERGFQRARWQQLTNWQRRPASRRIVEYMLNCGVDYDTLADPEQYRTAKGLPALFFTAAYLNFMRQAEEHGVHLFLAISSVSWIDTIAAVWATWDGNIFDYRTTYDLVRELNALRTVDFARYLQQVIDVFERRPIRDGVH